MQDTPAVFVTQDQLYPILYDFANVSKLRKSKKEIAKLLTSEQRCRNYPSLFQLYTSWAQQNPQHNMVIQASKGSKKCHFKEPSTKKKRRRSADCDRVEKPKCPIQRKKERHRGVSCPIPKRTKSRKRHDCEREQDCDNHPPNVCMKSDRYYKENEENGCTFVPQSYRTTYRKKSTTKSWILPGQSDTDSCDEMDDVKDCGIRGQDRAPCKQDMAGGGGGGKEETCASTSNASACDIEALRRINENLIKQNEALVSCPYKKHDEIDPDSGLSRQYYEERVKRMREMLREVQEARERALQECRRLQKEIKKLEESEECATSRYKSVQCENRKLRCKVQSLKDELRFQIETNNEEIKRLNELIFEAHKKEVDDDKKRENVPLLIEKIRKEFEDLQDLPSDEEETC